MSTLQVSNVNFESTANNQLVYSANTLTVRAGGASLMIANSTAINAVSNTFNLGTSAKTANGYTWLPNGLLMQWGAVVSNTSAGNATFAIAFPTACLSCSTSGIAAVANNIWQIAAANTTVATIRCSSVLNPATANIQYIAVGY